VPWIPGSRRGKPACDERVIPPPEGLAIRLLGKIIAIRRRGGTKETSMVVLGLILLLIGLLVGPSILTTIGLILLVVGLVLNFVPVGGTRRRYY
jgi:hypothetical protein